MGASIEGTHNARRSAKESTLEGSLNVISPRLSLRAVATVVVVVASAWFALAMTWGLFGPLTGSHAALSGAHGVAADNMLTWGIWGPVPEYALSRPPPQLYDTDHPWGTFWLLRGLMKLFGRHTYVLRLFPVLLSIATPPLLYAIGRALWGPVPGALSALAYVVVPLTLASGNCTGFEVPLVFGCLVTTWGYLRFAQRWKRRWLYVSLLGVICVSNADWQGSVFMGVVLGSLLVTQLLLPRWFGRVPARRFGQWWAFSMAIVSLTIAAYAAYFAHIDAVDRVLSHLAIREQGHELPVRQLLAERSYRTTAALTPVAIAVGKMALPVFFFRVAFLRQGREVFPIALLAMASATLVHFPNDADASFAGLLPFAAYWALSIGVLAATWIGAGRWVLRRYALRDEHDALVAGALAGLGVVALLILPDGIRALWHARASGGSFDDRDHRVFEGADKAAALQWMSDRMKGSTRVAVHASLHPTWADGWALHRPIAAADGLPTRAARADDRYFIGDLALMAPADHTTMAGQFHLTVVSSFVFVDRMGPSGPADGYVLDARAPTALEWCFVSAASPVLTVRADPWYTWELREQFGQTPNPPPEASPITPNELRVAHNVALAAGDQGRADSYEEKLVEQLLIYPAVTFTDGTRLLGERFLRGAERTLEVYFSAAGPTTDDVEFEIQSSVQKRPLFSLVAADDKVRVLGQPPAIPPKLWRRGFIYVSRSQIDARSGREAFVGSFVSAVGPDRGRGPKPRDGSGKIRLLTLE
jgi:4-amino-4-deoxy-L-arabinose transferase-like glycosyltransferase